MEPNNTPPFRVIIKRMMTERVELYWQAPSMDHTIPVGATPFPVEDSVSKNKEITWEVRRLCLNRSVWTLVVWV